ncbi:MAG: metal-dependent transcriptional regulator [Bacteroidetes bacterium]|jgi:DtxR family Mn-dependent transcriptional regulator|nr:metal-dependent transcriptional regulator [Bacteroidota bacterium]
MIKTSDEKYLKAIYHVSQSENTEKATISELAYYLDLRPPTVLERLKILQQEKLITYNKKAGIQLTKTGHKEALNVIRKHRIWETFLHKVCKFSWSEVHELAEQLQNVNSDKLIDRIYTLSGEPKFDPHGDPIPDKTGKLPASQRRPLLNSVEGCRCVILGVNEDSTDFLNYLTDLKLGLNDKLTVEKIFTFDGSLKIRYKNNEQAVLSSKVAEKILVTCIKAGCSCKS